MPTYRVRAVLPYTTGLPRDAAINTYHVWRLTPLDETELIALSTAFNRFYSVAPPSPGGVSLGTYMSSVITRSNGGCRTEIYNLDDPEPRPPVRTGPFTLAAPAGGSNLPLEVAVVNSFQGPRIAGAPQARRRGRSYIGPLRVAAFDGTSYPVIATPLRQLLISASQKLRQDVLDDVGALWVVRSSTTGDVTTISNGWVDDDPDTQRRRGTRASARYTWSV